MITISAFADEISPDLKVQMDTLEANGVRNIDVRGIDNTNVSKMTLEKVRQYKAMMDDRGFGMPCVGSPIGKIRMDEDFKAHLDLLKHCMDIAGIFGARYIRVFSFYPSQGKKIQDERGGVMDRLAAMIKLAELNDIILLHENESAIYGSHPQAILDIFATLRSPNFKSVFDPANFVVEGLRPFDEAWQKGLGEIAYYMHIKDKNPDEEVCVPAGTGAGQFEPIFADLAARQWSGVATLEPHLSKAGQFAGFTGPELFGKAATALKGLCQRHGIAFR